MSQRLLRCAAAGKLSGNGILSDLRGMIGIQSTQAVQGLRIRYPVRPYPFLWYTLKPPMPRFVGWIRDKARIGRLEIGHGCEPIGQAWVDHLRAIRHPAFACLDPKAFLGPATFALVRFGVAKYVCANPSRNPPPLRDRIGSAAWRVRYSFARRFASGSSAVPV